VLQKWSKNHIEQLPRIANNPKIEANMADTFPSPYKPEDANTWIQQARIQSDRPSWAIESSGQLIGGIGLSVRSVSASHCAGLVYWIGEPYWEYGYATGTVSKYLPMRLILFDLFALKQRFSNGTLLQYECWRNAAFLKKPS
jgi:RimJ/RimL family protein N-acetyltransferase